MHRDEPPRINLRRSNSKIEDQAPLFSRLQKVSLKEHKCSPNGRMARHGNLTFRRKDPDRAVSPLTRRLLQKGRLGKIQLLSDLLHLFLPQVISIWKNRQGVSTERLIGEDIDQVIEERFHETCTD